MTLIFFLSLKKQSLEDQPVQQHMSIYTCKEAAYTYGTHSPVHMICNMPPQNSRGTSHILCSSHMHIDWLTISHFHCFSSYYVTNEATLQKSCLKGRFLFPDEEHRNLSNMGWYGGESSLKSYFWVHLKNLGFALLCN